MKNKNDKGVYGRLTPLFSSKGVVKMNKIIVITGDLATGKSTYAELLSQKYHILLLTKDKIKELLADQIGFKDRTENLRLSRGSMAVMFYVLAESMKISAPLILEANFKAIDIKTLYDLTWEKVPVLVLNFTADYEILYNRFKRRIEKENRHPVHQSAGLLDFNKFKEYLDIGRAIDLSKFKVINVLANDFSYQNDLQLFQEIENFLYDVDEKN